MHALWELLRERLTSVAGCERVKLSRDHCHWNLNLIELCLNGVGVQILEKAQIKLETFTSEIFQIL